MLMPFGQSTSLSDFWITCCSKILYFCLLQDLQKNTIKIQKTRKDHSYLKQYCERSSVNSKHGTLGLEIRWSTLL
jgi:hypothetical protein